MVMYGIEVHVSSNVKWKATQVAVTRASEAQAFGRKHNTGLSRAHCTPYLGVVLRRTSKRWREGGRLCCKAPRRWPWSKFLVATTFGCRGILYPSRHEQEEEDEPSRGEGCMAPKRRTRDEPYMASEEDDVPRGRRKRSPWISHRVCPRPALFSIQPKIPGMSPTPHSFQSHLSYFIADAGPASCSI